MKKYINTYFVEILLIAIFGFIPLLWYKNGSFALGHDMGFPLAPVDHFLDRLFVWTERVGSFGSNQSESVSAFFIHGIEALFYFLGFDLVTTQKIVFMFWLIAPGISMYVLLISLHPKRNYWPMRIGGSLFYMINHFFLQAWFIAERTKFSAAVSLPLITLFTINAIYRKKSILVNALLTGLTLFIFNAGPGIPLYAGLGIVVGFAILYFTFVNLRKQNLIPKIMHAVLFILGAFLSFLLLNMYWIAPLFLYSYASFDDRVGQAGGVEGAISWSREISKNTSFANLFRLQGIPDWYDNPNHPYSNVFINNPIFVLISFIWPIIAFGSLYFANGRQNKRNAYLPFFILLSLIGIFFAAGSHYPSGALYDLLLRKIPGFSVLRTPFYKFGIVIWFSYAYLIGFVLTRLLEYWNAVKIERFIKKSVVILASISLLGIFAIYNYPYFTGDFFHWSKNYSTMLKVPNYVFDFKEWIDRLDGSSNRILLLPDLDPNTKYEIYDWKYFSLSTLPTILTNRSVVSNDAYLKGNEDTLVRVLYDEIASENDFSFAKYLGINYTLIREDFVAPLNSSYHTTNLLNSIKEPSFSLVKDFGRWKVYKSQNQQSLPLIYLTNKDTYIDSSLSSLDTIINIPGFDLGNSFFITESMPEYEIPQEMISTSVIQGSCVSCLPKHTVISTSTSRAYPHSRLIYFLEKIRENRQENSMILPEQRIDYLLGKVIKKHSLIQTTLNEKKNYVLMPSLFSDIRTNFEKSVQINKIVQDLNQQRYYNDRIIDYRDFTNKKIDEWIRTTNDTQLQSNLMDLKWSLGNLDLKEKEKKTVDTNTFSFNIPSKSSYKLLMNFDRKFIDKLLSEQSILKTTESGNATPNRLSEDWIDLGIYELDPGNNEIRIPFEESLTINDTLPKSIDLYSPVDEVVCKDLSLEDINKDLSYKVSFLYRTEIGEPLRFKVEQDLDYIYPEKRPQLKVDSLLKKDSAWSKYETEFKPDKYTQKVNLQFCINSNSIEDSKAFVEDLSVSVRGRPNLFVVSETENDATRIPVLRFAKINQTKYVLSIDDIDGDYFINFNQRFDNGWKIKPVVLVNSEVIFSETQLSNKVGNTYEYNLPDDFKVSDSVSYKKVVDQELSHLTNNGFNNAWIIGPTENTYILEYEPQAYMYKGVIVSTISLVSVWILLIIFRIRYKKDVQKD